MTLRRFLKSIKTNTKVEKKILNLNLYNKYYIRSNNIKLNEIVLFLDNNNNVIICLDFMKKIKDVIDIKTPQYTVSYPLFTFKNQNLSFQLPHFRNLKVEAQKLNFIFKNFKSILKKKKIKALLISSIRGGYLLYCCGVRGFMPTSAYNFFSKNLQINDFSNYNFYFLS